VAPAASSRPREAPGLLLVDRNTAVRWIEGGGGARVCRQRRTGGSVAARVWVRGQGGAEATYKGSGWLLGM
jgi:hypothetical protein